jgi:pyruvate,water dikinase
MQKMAQKKKKFHEKQNSKFCLTDEEVVKLAKWCYQIEKYFSKNMDIISRWISNGQKTEKTGELFIVQARPETVVSGEDKNVLKEYKLKKSKVLVSGIAVGSKIGSGKVRVLHNAKNINAFQKRRSVGDGNYRPRLGTDYENCQRYCDRQRRTYFACRYCVA